MKIVARKINSGDFTKLKPVYFRCVDKTISNFFEKKYFNEFRPWWYGQFDSWSKYDFKDEVKKHDQKVSEEFERWSGINLKLYGEYFQLNHKDMPKRQHKRKERKQKEQPIRKLKNPQEYNIALMADGQKTWKPVIGESAFQYRGYEFFIAHYDGCWVVSDVATGSRVASHDRYKMAIKIAKERIEKHFDAYVSHVSKCRQEESA